MTTYKIAHDSNGNRIVKVQVPGERGFSIQTNGNLPRTHRDGISKDDTTASEVYAYARDFGTERQRAVLGML